MIKKKEKARRPRLLIAGGGTGGHLYPGIAVSEAFLKRFPIGEVLFVGTERGLEARILPQLGIRLRCIKVRPLVGKSLFSKVSSLALLPTGACQAWNILGDFCPTYVLGIGGYASGPLLSVAAARGMRTAILEPNAVPGLTNRILGVFVNIIFAGLGFDQDYFSSEKTWIVGTPIRSVLMEGECAYNPQTQQRFHVLVTGGSQGARALNRAMIGALNFIRIPLENLHITHQTGFADCQWVSKQYKAFPGISVKVLPFIENMFEAYRNAHLVISRAGASTLSEISAMSRPSILVPYMGANSHQVSNAKLFERAGAALAIYESELSGRYLAEVISTLYADSETLMGLSEGAAKFHRKDAADRIVELLVS